MEKGKRGEAISEIRRPCSVVSGGRCVFIKREACSAERRLPPAKPDHGDQAGRQALPPHLSPSLPPSLVRIATVLDRTIHPYKRRIWFWIGAAAAHTGRATETQKQLHRQETDGSHSLADQISLFSLSPISSDGNTKWGGGGVSTSRTLTRPPTTTTTRRRKRAEKVVRDRGPSNSCAQSTTISGILHAWLDFMQSPERQGTPPTKPASKQAAIFHLCDVAVSKARRATPITCAVGVGGQEFLG